MMKRLPAFFPLLGLSLFLSGCIVTAFMPSGSWRYRMTVEVETPEGLKTGSAVREVHVQQQPAPLPEMSPVKKTVKGEAVVVDLGERGQLYALLRSERSVDYSYYVVYDAFPNPLILGDNESLIQKSIRYYSNLEASKELPLSLYPMLVTFTDPNDPSSVQPVFETMSEHPERKDAKVTLKEDYFEALFGKGVRLRRITIEMTEDRVTWGIEKWLPWLSKYYNQRLDGNRFGTLEADNRLANSLSSGAFSTGENK